VYVLTGLGGQAKNQEGPLPGGPGCHKKRKNYKTSEKRHTNEGHYEVESNQKKKDEERF